PDSSPGPHKETLSVNEASPTISIVPIVRPIGLRLVVLRRARSGHVDIPPLVRLAVTLAALPAARTRVDEDVLPGRVAVLGRAGEGHADAAEVTPLSGLEDSRGSGRCRGGARQEGDDEAVEEGGWGEHGGAMC
ncbi:hypothetical protein B0T18DRAFT_62080, partial [Schizothecium vesticola]